MTKVSSVGTGTFSSFALSTAFLKTYFTSIGFLFTKSSIVDVLYGPMLSLKSIMAVLCVVHNNSSGCQYLVCTLNMVSVVKSSFQNGTQFDLIHLTSTSPRYSSFEYTRTSRSFLRKFQDNAGESLFKVEHFSTISVFGHRTVYH